MDLSNGGVTMPEVIQYKCPCCDAGIVFNSATGKVKCPYCDTEFDVEDLENYEKVLGEKSKLSEDINWDISDEMQWEDDESQQFGVYTCNNCSGQVVTDSVTGAMTCPFCGAPVIFSDYFSGDLKPNYIIPFAYDKEAAKEAMKRHTKGKVLLPKVFLKENHIDNIKGIYVPFWLFDADVNASVEFRATRSKVWSDYNYRYTDTSFYSVVRTGNVSFEKIPIDGAWNMPDDLMESIEPFDFKDAKEFSPAYLSGYLAERYDVTKEESVDRADRRVKKSTEDEFKRTVVGYDTVTMKSSTVKMNAGRISYALYPVWVLNTTYKGKNYIFAMNGQTGRFAGDLPMDKKALYKWFFGLFGGATLVALLFQLFIWTFA